MIRRAVIPAALSVLLPLLVLGGGPSTGADVAASAVVPAAALQSGAAPVATESRAQVMERLGLRWYRPLKVDRPLKGPTFNNPLGSREAQRTNITRIVRQVNAARGFKVPKGSHCPYNPAHYPNNIRIVLYSFSEGAVTDALIAAHKRCISVQVLMNDHLTNAQVPAFGRLQKVLGTNKSKRSWARRCTDGCRGRVGPLHTKFFLIDRIGELNQVITFGSSNMTGKAAYVQWNDLYTLSDRPVMWSQFQTIWNEMRADRVAPEPIERNYVDGGYLTMFWPQPGHTKGTDRVLKVLKEVRCNVTPTGGTGYAGRTAVAVNIHAMEGERGLYIAQQLVAMRKAGCRVRVLYGLIAPRIHRTFKDGGVPSRRTIFDRNEDDLTDQYTHMKVLAVNGAYGSSTGRRLVFTGSENFSQKTVGGDEIWMQIPRGGVWKKYQALFDKIWSTPLYSAPDYKFYSQTDTPTHGRLTTTDFGTPLRGANPYPLADDTLRITSEDLEE